MKRALIVLGLEVALLAVAVAAYLANERSAVQWPKASVNARSAVAPARSSVPVSILISHRVGTVETAALTRGGKARGVGRAGRVAVNDKPGPRDAGAAASTRAHP